MALRFPAFENSTVRQPRWLAAGDIAFATWVKLCCRCAEDENGGRLAGAGTWDERIWLTLANVTRGGVDAAVASALCRWDGEDLEVMGYDHAAQAKIETLRNNGQFGHLGGRPAKQKPKGKPRGLQNHNPLTLPYLSDQDPPYGGSGSAPARGEAPGGPGPGNSASAPPVANGAATAAIARWSGGRWLERFRAAFWDAKGRQYGRGEADARAATDLTDRLGSIDDAARAALEAGAAKVFAAYFAMGGGVETANHPFKWMVERFNEWGDWAAGKGPVAPRRTGGYVPVHGRKDWHAGMDKLKS